MIKKSLKKILSISLATGILVGGTTASAEVIGYVTESNGVKYQYSQEDLIESIINKTVLYERYRTERLVALVDDKNGYIDADEVINAIVEASINEERFNVNDYTESELAKVIELQGVKRLGSSGDVLPSEEEGDKEDIELEDEKVEYTDSKYFEFDSSKGEIVYYKLGGPKRVIIPKEIEGVAVTSIRASAFSNYNLTEVEIPNSVKSIGEGAFQGNDLTSVTIPSSVTTIGNSAFEKNKLTSIEIPNSITAIGDTTFQWNQLSSVEIPNSVKSIGDRAFQFNNLSELVIPSSVNTIGEGAFGSNNLESVEISESVKTISKGSFSRNNLSNVRIPNSVESIEMWAFSNNKLSSLEIPDSVTSIESLAFSENEIKHLVIADSVTDIGTLAFARNSLSEDSVTLGSGYPEFLIYDKENPNKLLGHILGGNAGELVIPLGVTHIGDEAFYGLGYISLDLNSIKIPETVEYIGDRAFAGNNLTSLHIPKSVKVIGEESFMQNKLLSVEIPENTTIQSNSFGYTGDVIISRY